MFFAIPRMIGTLGATLLLAGLLNACGGASGPQQMNIKLDWRSTDDPADLSSAPIAAFNRAKVALGTFADLRADKTRIGAGHDDRWPVRTTSDLAPFVRTEIGKLIERRGGQLAASDPKKLLSADITEFFVREDNLYQARVTLHVRLTDAAGQVGWEQTYDGKSNRWGGSWNPDNYQEAYSGALFEVVKALLGDPGFLAALG